VTSCDPGRRHIPECEDLHAVVAGYLYLTSRARVGMTYLPNVIQDWEDYRPGEGQPTQDEAADVLGGAAAALAQAAPSASTGSACPALLPQSAA
jgi:hypothetical protein